MDPVLRRVIEIVTQVAGPGRTPAEVGPSTPLAVGGFWLDSMELFEVILACEAAFGPVFGGLDEDAARILHTAGSLATAIRAGTQARPDA